MQTGNRRDDTSAVFVDEHLSMYGGSLSFLVHDEDQDSHHNTHCHDSEDDTCNPPLAVAGRIVTYFCCKTETDLKVERKVPFFLSAKLSTLHEEMLHFLSGSGK